MTEAEFTFPARILAVTSCSEGSEIVLLCSNNHLVQLVQSESGFIDGRKMTIEERVSLVNTVHMVKLDVDLFAVFDNRGSIRFISLADPELVKFKTSFESQNCDLEEFSLLKHSERQDLLRDPEFQVLKFEIEALSEYIEANPHMNGSIFAEE